MMIKKIKAFLCRSQDLGAGAYWKVKDEFDLFMEAKLIVANQLQLVGNVGILLNMEYLWSKEKESGY